MTKKDQRRIKLIELYERLEASLGNNCDGTEVTFVTFDIDLSKAIVLELLELDGLTSLINNEE